MHSYKCFVIYFSITIIHIASTWAFGLPEISSFDKSVTVNIAASNYYLNSAKSQKAYIKIELTAPEMVNSSDRQPLNLAIVLDRSTLNSNTNRQIITDSIIDLVSQLHKNDTLSVISFSNKINTIIPASRVNNHKQISEIIKNIKPDKGSMLFAAISKAALEVRKFNKPDVINRIILISSEAITIGPGSSETMEDLGYSLSKENITVTAIGLGNRFDEKCLARLAIKSGGHFYYSETVEQIPQILTKEISNALTVTVKDIQISVSFSKHIRSMDPLAREEKSSTDLIHLFIKELYANVPYSIIVEADVSPGQSTKIIDLAKIDISYSNILTSTIEKKTRTLKAIYINNEQIIKNNINRKVMAQASFDQIIDKYNTILNLRENRNTAKAVATAHEANTLLAEYNNTYENDKLELLKIILQKMPDMLQNNNLYYNGGRKQLLSIIHSNH